MAEISAGWYGTTLAGRAPQFAPLIFMFAIAGAAVGVYAFFRAFPLLRRKRLILDTPTSTIRAASLGHIEVSGTALGPYTLLSPLSQQDCYYYRAVAWTRGREKDSWKKASEETLRAPLFLDDGTGRLLVDPTGAELDLDPAFDETYSEGAFSSEKPDNVRHFLSRRGVESDHGCRVEEFCIVPQQRLFIQGTLRENTAEEAPGDGHLLSREAAALQRRVELERMFLPGERLVGQEPAESSVAGQEFDVNPRVVLGRGDGRRPFFISRSSERRLLQSLEWQSTLYLWGGPLLTLVCLWYLLSRLP